MLTCISIKNNRVYLPDASFFKGTHWIYLIFRNAAPHSALGYKQCSISHCNNYRIPLRLGGGGIRQQDVGRVITSVAANGAMTMKTLNTFSTWGSHSLAAGSTGTTQQKSLRLRERLYLTPTVDFNTAIPPRYHQIFHQRIANKALVYRSKIAEIT